MRAVRDRQTGQTLQLSSCWWWVGIGVGVGVGVGVLIRIAWAEREQNPRNYVCSSFYLSLDMLSTIPLWYQMSTLGLLFVVTTIVDTVYEFVCATE